MHQPGLTSVVDTVICVTSRRRTIKASAPVQGKDPPPATRLEVTASSVGVPTVFPCDRAVRIDVRSALVVGDLGGLGGVVQVEPVERDSDQPSTDNVPDQGSQNVLPDVDGHRGTLVQHHTQGDDEHVGDDVLELGDDESGQDEIDPKDLSYEVTTHLGDENGEADHDVTPDTSEEDLVPFQGPSGSGGVGDKRLYGPRGESRVPDEDGAEEEGACQVSPEDDEIVVRQPPPRDPALDDAEEHDHHVRSQEFRSDQDDQTQSDGKDQTLNESQQSRVVLIGRRRTSYDGLEEAAV